MLIETGVNTGCAEVDALIGLLCGLGRLLLCELRVIVQGCIDANDGHVIDGVGTVGVYHD